MRILRNIAGHFPLCRNISARATRVPSLYDASYQGLGKAVVDAAHTFDTGKAAFEECLLAREQLELITHSIGYDMNIYIFGGLVTFGLFEVGGDVDFVGISDVEPDFDESGEIVSRTCREMRRLGLKARPLSKARVPVIKVDRVSRCIPGTPLHYLSCDGIFHFSRTMSPAEMSEFEQRVKTNFCAASVEWNASSQFATVRFSSSSALITAITQLKHHGSADIPLRLPIDVRHGPEIYRFPFDFCLSSTGLRNSHLLAKTLSSFPYARHLLLVVKKWGRSSGVINSIDGLLASYALTVMMTHFLIHSGVIDAIPHSCITDSSIQLQVAPDYRPLEGYDGCDFAQVGYLLVKFFEYFGEVFDYANRVVCTTNLTLSKEMMKWNVPSREPNRPPFFEFSIKDPFGLDNIARNLDSDSVQFVRTAHRMALDSLLDNFASAESAVGSLMQSPTVPLRSTRSLGQRGIRSEVHSAEQLEARHVLNKVEFHQRKRAMESFGRKAARNNEEQQLASNVARNVLGWIKSDDQK